MMSGLKLFFTFSAILLVFISEGQEVNIQDLFEKDEYLICLKKTKEPFTGIMFSKNDEGNIVYKKTVIDGVEDGPAWFYDKNGKVSGEGEFKGGVENGKWKWYHQNGKIKAEGFYENGVSSGRWKYWRENGTLDREGDIKNGKETNKWIYLNENGTIITERYYNSGLKHGTETWYYENGQRMIERHYESGIENGVFSGWFKNGQRKFEGNTVAGKITRYIEWDESGKAINIQNNDPENKNN